MLRTPFLTELDSRAAIKGSRDPLGVQQIWSRLGRQVVGNLTTVSNSVHDFTVLLLGYYFVERVADEVGTNADLATFLKWEQLAAYARAAVNKEAGFRGTERVHKRVQAGGRVQLGTEHDAQILSNQKIYGLWGLFTVPAKASGLLDGDPVRLTAAGRDLVENVYLKLLSTEGFSDGRAIVKRLREPTSSLELSERSKDAPLLKAIAKLIKALPPRAKQIYREHLLFGCLDEDQHKTQGRQRIFANLLLDSLDEKDWQLSPLSLADMARRARPNGSKGEELADYLNRICTVERLIAPSVAFFEYALGCDGQRTEDIAADVRKTWGTALRKTLDLAAIEKLVSALDSPKEDADAGRRWVNIARALHEARYEDVLDLLLLQNTAVMKARAAAAPWATVRDGRLQVQFRDEHQPHLPAQSELPRYWRHAYFIESLREVARTLRSVS